MRKEGDDVQLDYTHVDNKAEKTYLAIDLKSFYASVECVERGLDPLTTNLVVADASRTEKTICLAVSPSLKAYGIPGRPRLFEVVEKTRRDNIEYIVAQPRMALYMEYSTRIFDIYQKYVAPEDIHVYSVDEVFIDITGYLDMYKLTAKQLAMKMIKEVLKTTGITATAGIGTNLYLSKIAMDIVAKHMPADEDGVRIAMLDEAEYKKQLWNHRPITDFWRVGRGYARKLEEYGMYTMGDVARCSAGRDDEYYNEDLLYRLFGVNAQLLIDHAWGYEPCTLKDIKSYKPMAKSLGAGQVLPCAYNAKNAKIVITEMADQLSYDLLDKGYVTDQIVMDVGYDIENINDSDRKNAYKGEITKDRYGRKVPKHAHGTYNFEEATSSTSLITKAAGELYDRIVNPDLLIRRMNISACHIIRENDITRKDADFEQMDLFIDYEAKEKKRKEREEELNKERKIQEAMLSIKKKYGKNAVLRGLNFEEGATAMERNQQIGGHKA